MGNQDEFDKILSAVRDWELARVLVKGASIFPSARQLTPRSFLIEMEIETSEYLPDGMDGFKMPNSSTIIVTPAFLKRLTAYIDAWAEVEEAETVA